MSKHGFLRLPFGFSAPSVDQVLTEVDKGLRTVFAQAHTQRPYPDADLVESNALSAAEKKHAAALMRVNHVGEVCAQALYNGQALTSNQPETVAALQHAAQEETEHLAWCEKRIKELGGRKSLLNPLWYSGAFAMGTMAGALGNRWNMGFLAETEHQVGEHLQSHLSKLPVDDVKSRAIVTQMQADEAEHADMALQNGGAQLPPPVKWAMRAAAKVMTTTVYRI